MAAILIVDDDLKVRKIEDTYLRMEGFETFTANNGAEALCVLDEKRVDLIVTDIIMPEMDGKELVRLLRSHNIWIPVIVMASRSSFKDKRQLFELGADDYMTKPVDLEELVMRIRAILRRCRVCYGKQLKIGNTILDYIGLEVRQRSDSVTLPQKEFYLLFLLLSFPGRIFTRQELMDEIWGADSNTSERTVDVHINRLRERFCRQQDFQILTVRGLGYKAVVLGDGKESLQTLDSDN